MNDEIKALKERIEKLENVIVYLMCPKAHGVSEKSKSKKSSDILEEGLSVHIKRAGVNYLLNGIDAEQVIKEAYDQINK